MIKNKLVVRFIPLFNRWFLCHEKSYQAAFRKGNNGFKTRGEACEYAAKQGFEVVKHKNDQLQNYQQALARKLNIMTSEYKGREIHLQSLPPNKQEG